ncbi:YebC/PmpR family DNA-binding transcriptional regulator [Mycoplasma tauri]|uniref:Probable transcriptional regulatory protein LAD73_02885 n=1 Tax=Mycoplasma tauri TaxID=547987 RepID=A0A953T542_9MOLU|nr:YebC/PmpR family DNA-binding transcriptional regulator [Mycoplasma tauri]MBZ4195645.1 YebC/PmpR family DNA-binding transcriptional regulator [Mycoplasma tauri]MBZ4203379.1 YebC/PmpR family DNA-binding transcriptional regulator [Mycoplasma tauri]MBZ4204532.1 YebC/PmpR family DNA-binding transcriptional regulator [Mycoplasma tauri]MBZ4212690.1 YebC/PmpR family DNA-binding transcriptional regulator [Mycoplasma tauri]MBZ4218042.1 YebC/PmpR family DNA-binding transcriptional regulator [Mycoplasm
MAGHSHWAGIKHKKGANDAARGKIFQKMFKEIYVAATASGGPDPDSNPALRLAIAKARAKSMPKANIERALDKAKGNAKEGANFVEILYNATISGGASFLVVALSDNINRTTSSIQALFNKQNAKLGKTGTVPFQFDHKGILEISKTLVDEETLTLVCLENGAEDVEVLDESFLITTAPEDFSSCKSAVESNLNITEFLQCEVTYIPNSTVSFEGEKAIKIQDFIAKLEDDDDVQEVYHNIEFLD